MSGVEHAVTVAAESLYEAAALGYEAFCGDGLAAGRPGPTTVLEVAVHPPPVCHKVNVGQLRQWLAITGKTPREQILKQRVGEILDTKQAPRT